MTKTVNYTIMNAENGYIVNSSIETETEKDNTFSSTFTSETYVFSDWAAVLEWLKNAEADRG